MPDNLCRTCGGDLIRWSTCSDCRKVTQRICKICCEKTIEAFHLHHTHLEPHISAEQEVLAIVQDYNPTAQKNPAPSHRRRKYGRTVLAMSVIAGIIIAGMYVADYSESHLNPTLPGGHVVMASDTASTPEHPVQVQLPESNANMVQPSTDTRYTYSNCIGVSDGMQLTVICPTGYGAPYKAVVKIPAELIVQLETDVFNLREISVIEHADSISMQYAKRTYEAKFVSS